MSIDREGRHRRPRDVPRPREFGKDSPARAETRARKRTAAGARDPSSKEWLGVTNGRVRKEDGTTFPAQSARAGVAPRRPPICMLFEDLAQGEEQPTGVFGMYPAALIPKILPWLRCRRAEVLHVCSGGLPPGEGLRVDVRPEARPDVIADGRKMPFASGSMPAALLDPPYSEHYARELYNVDYPRPSHLLAEASRVVRPGGRIGFVHYIVPNPPDGCHHVKTFGLSMGFGYPMRAVTIYEKEQDGLFEARP